jgi:hypothetical protein
LTRRLLLFGCFFYLMKGAVIASDADPDKNKLSTDTLTFSDIENKAEYSASSVGVNLDTRKTAETKDAGLTPAIGTKATGDADSTTKSAIAEGTIEVRSGDTDLNNLSRDTANSLNALGKIFDKKTVAEQQELAKVFGEVAFNLVHKISKENGWDEGSPQKIALHAFVGAVMADMGGGNALSGAAGAGFNEAIQKELAEKFKDNPDLHQWASAIVGSAAATVVGGDAQTGGSTAASGTKNNFLSDWQKEQREQALKDENWEMVAYWDAIDKAQDQAITYLGVYPGTDLNDPVNSRMLEAVSKLGQEIEASPDFQGSFLSNAPTVDSSTLVAAGAGAIVVAGVTLYYYNGGWVKAAPVVGSGIVGVGGANNLAKVGDNFGRLGTLAENPSIVVNWSTFAEHGLERMAQRGVTPDMVQSWVANGKALAQGDNKFLFITREGAAVVTRDGKLVTTYPASKFDANMVEVVKKIFGE